MRDNPRSVVRRTLRVAARAPREIRLAAFLLSDIAASARGEPEAASSWYPMIPTYPRESGICKKYESCTLHDTNSSVWHKGNKPGKRRDKFMSELITSPLF